ncbi:MAG: glycoside hydrolase family 3 N-terminal domain-containing protein [Schaedlerella sp.]|nr:glycoside hydrolase family 3 N-terminal domain-containing protein [Schaedlerella sp.]
MKMKVRNKALWTDEVTMLEKKNKKTAYQAALEGIVLLENDGTLPIKPGKIALYGAGAGMTIKGGTGSGEVNERHAVSIMEGLETAGFTITTKKWIAEYARLYKAGEAEYIKEFQKKILRLNMSEIMNIVASPYQYPFGQAVTKRDVEESDTDTCIYVVARQAGEGADKRLERNEYSLSKQERINIKRCAAVYKKMIVVINTGSSFDMNFLDEIQGINAVVFFGQQGTMGGMAFADLICARVSPSGKLSDTWAKNYEDIPFAGEYSYLNGNLDEEYYKEGIYVGYRYFDSFHVEPKYPFGYGLSYTEFKIKVKSVSIQKTEVVVKVSVKNSGDTFAGKEVVQLYVSCPKGEMDKEYQRLSAFAKTKVLMPGEREKLTLRFKMEDMASYREGDAVMLLDQGTYILRIGNSSRNTKICAAVRLKETIITQQHQNVCKLRNALEELKSAEYTEEIPEDISVFMMNPEEFNTERYVYKNPEIYSSDETDALLDQLSLKELTYLTVGNGLEGGKYFQAPGAAGSTTSKLIHKGVPNICLADGPAGLRLQKRSVVMPNGKIKAVDPFLSLMNYMPEAMKKLVLGNPEKHPVIYQFTTAFPTGLALAQTWNEELLEAVGSAVGEEMEVYGVTYWLAPALNIHRNPLCGRNFEYFSEDPFLSGTACAAITKGVQKHRGCYVTLKHFCCNNQEDNRGRTNANISERALREIYLRGFEIAVKNGRPGSVMSSYNKVNGTYTSNSHDLLTKILRNEWGFQGLVMTDWFATGKKLANPARAIEAGNDLIMPGTSAAEKEIFHAAECGVLDKNDLKRCAANVLKGIISSRIYQAYRRSRRQDLE